MVVDNVFFKYHKSIRFDSITFIYTINYLSLNACAYFYRLFFLRAVFLQLRSQRDWSEKTETSSLTLISCEYWDYFLSDLDRRNAIYGTFFMDFCEINNLQQFGIYVNWGWSVCYCCSCFCCCRGDLDEMINFKSLLNVRTCVFFVLAEWWIFLILFFSTIDVITR